MSTLTRPVIGVTGPDSGGLFSWLFLRMALLRFGARVVRISPKRPHSARELDGLIIGGGADVDPELYGETVLAHVNYERAHLRPVSPRSIVLFLLRSLLAPRSPRRRDPGPALPP